MKKNQSGFTLIEISFVLVIIGLLIGGVMGAKTYIDTQKANNEAVAMQRVISQLVGKYMSYSKTSAVTTASAITGKVFDSSFGVDAAANTVTNVFGGNVTVAPTVAGDLSAASTAGDGFVLSSAEIPTAICQKMIPLLQGFVTKIDVGATNVQAAVTSPGTPSAIDTACSSATAVQITFKFPKNGV